MRARISAVSIALCLVALACAAALALGPTPARAASAPPPNALDGVTAELHAHLFMKEGMTWMFRGDFNGPLEATSWRDRFSSQANPETVESSGIGLLVATIYAHPIFTMDLRESVRRQVKLAQGFITSHPDWVLARDAGEARRALDSGKRVMVLGLEGADKILVTDADLDEFVEGDGIRIVTILHLTDDSLGGVAFLPGFEALADPWAWFVSLFGSRPSEGVRANPNGLTDAGRALAAKFIQHGVWIDLAHSSDASQRVLIPMMRAKDLPLLYTHTTLRKYLGAERGIADWQLDEVAKSRGIVGLMPSEAMLAGTVIAPALCPASCGGKCEGGVEALAQQYGEVATRLGSDPIMFGSDFNGGIPHLHPTCGLPGEGFWNIGQTGALWGALEKLGAPVPQPRRRMVDRFIEAWARVAP